MSLNAVCVWDFTIPFDRISINELKEILKEKCKKWVFQVEVGASGYKHYQGRVSLKVKSRKAFPMDCGVHWSVTSNDNMENDFYCVKDDTRVDGPYRDCDRYIPRQVRDIVLKPWQAYISNDLCFDTRSINVVICASGNIGKTTLATYLGSRGIARNVPIMESYKDFMRFCMDVPTSRLYLVDFPRSLNKSSCGNMWSAIESIKNGYAWDDRYCFREKYFDCPNIWVFSNQEPDIGMLSADRWRLWEVQDDKLVTYVECG